MFFKIKKHFLYYVIISLLRYFNESFTNVIMLPSSICSESIQSSTLEELKASFQPMHLQKQNEYSIAT